MFSTSLINGFVILSNNMVQKEPGSIVGPIASIFGFIINIIFNFVYSITGSDANLLGISIILLTIIARFAMMPLAVKSQKSMAALQKIQPEVEKLREKYGDSKDPEVQKKMQIELNNLYREHKANPFGGCLPLFIQFPIFMALFYIMNQSYRFIDRLGSLYEQLSMKIMEVPLYYEYLYDIGFAKVPKGMRIDFKVTDDLMKLLSKFKADDWAQFFEKIPSEYAPEIQAILDSKLSVEQFLGIGLTENTGLYWPVILIPILAVLTSFLSSYLSMRNTKTNDPSAKMQQRVMMVMMPVFMGFITVGMPGGVGLYWITSSVFQVIQQLVLNKVFNKNDGQPAKEAVEKPIKKR